MKRAFTATALALLAIAVGVATTFADHTSHDTGGDAHVEGDLEVDGTIVAVGQISHINDLGGSKRFRAGVEGGETVSWGYDGNNFMIWDDTSTNAFQVSPTELIAWHHLRPVSNNTYLLGTNGRRWKSVLANSIDVDGVAIIDGAAFFGDVIVFSDSGATIDARIDANGDGDVIIKLGD